MPVAETFNFRDEQGRSLSDLARTGHHGGLWSMECTF